MTHSQVLDSLYDHLKAPDQILFREPNLSGWASGNDYGLPDILRIPISHSRFTRHIYEVKASQSDLLSDLRASKWERYLPICDRLTFALNDGIDYKTHLWHLPVGIMTYSGKTGKWRTVRAASQQKNARDWPDGVWRSLLFGRMGETRGTRSDRMEAERRILLSEEIRDLILSRNKEIKEKTRAFCEQERALRELKIGIEHRESLMKRKEEEIVAQAEQRAVFNLMQKLGASPSRFQQYEESQLLDYLILYAISQMRQKIKDMLTKEKP